MRRFLTSLTLASTVMIAGCTEPSLIPLSEADILAATEQQGGRAMNQTVHAVADGQVSNMISGKIELPISMEEIAANLETGTPPMYLHAFRATGEVIRDARVSLMTADEKTYSFVVDNVPANEPVVLAATIEPGIVLRAVVPAASAESPARAQVINTQTEAITQELVKLGAMPHVGTFGLGSVLAQGGLDPAAAAEANEKAAAAYDELANTEWGRGIPEVRDAAIALREIANAQRETARKLEANGGVLPPGVINTGGGNYHVLGEWWCLWLCGGDQSQKVKNADDAIANKAKNERPGPEIDSVFNKISANKGAAKNADAHQPAPPAPKNGSLGNSGANIIATGGLNFTVKNGYVYGANSNQLIGHAGGNLAELAKESGGNLSGQLLPNKAVFFKGRAIGKIGNNIIATGGGNIIATGGLNVIATGGGNIISTGGGNIIATGGLNIISTGGGNFRIQPNGDIYAVGNTFDQTGGKLIGHAGGNLIGHAGGNIIASGGLNFRVKSADSGDVQILPDGTVNQAGVDLARDLQKVSKSASDFFGALDQAINVVTQKPPLPPMRDRLAAVEDALKLETQKQVAPNGDPFTASEIESFLNSGKNPYRTDCSQISFEPTNQSCRVVVSPKGVQEVMVTRKAKSLEAYISQVTAAWKSNDTTALDRLFKENPALVNFVDHPTNAAWKSPIGTWRMRVVQLKGNDGLPPQAIIVNDAETTIAQKGQKPTEVLPPGPVSAMLSTWFSYGSLQETTDVLNSFAMKFSWKEDGRLLENGAITGENRSLDNRTRTLYNATFSGQMMGDYLSMAGTWQSKDGQTSGIWEMIRGPRTFSIPYNL